MLWNRSADPVKGGNLEMERQRCDWVTQAPLYQAYHDEEWGVPVRDDRSLFEFLILEGAQAGLSWYTVLKKRENYRAAFANFDVGAVAAFDADKVEDLMGDSGIIRNRLKINSAICNAKAVLGVQAEFGSLAEYLWSFAGGEPLVNHWQTLAEVPTTSAVSDALSKALKKRGFRFVGSTICYAFMQATGMVMDHAVTCFRYAEII